jgi:virulence-associated protein VapD
MYRYQDNSLEAASDIDKLMWRLGFENTNNIQKFLRDLKSRM